MGGSGQGVCLFLLSFAVFFCCCFVLFLLASVFSFVCVLLLLLLCGLFFCFLVCFVLGDGGGGGDVYA